MGLHTGYTSPFEPVLGCKSNPHADDEIDDRKQKASPTDHSLLEHRGHDQDMDDRRAGHNIRKVLGKVVMTSNDIQPIKERGQLGS